MKKNMKIMRMMMTDWLKISIAAVLICLVALFILISAGMESQEKASIRELTQLMARKQDISSELLRLQQLITDLNATLDEEVEKQAGFSEELKATQQEVGMAVNRTVLMTVKKPVPVSAQAPAPPVQQSRPSTRAS